MKQAFRKRLLDRVRSCWHAVHHTSTTSSAMNTPMETHPGDRAYPCPDLLLTPPSIDMFAGRGSAGDAFIER